MSNQETMNYLSSLRHAIEDYAGFTRGEKSYAVTHLNSWVGNDGKLDKLTENFAMLSLDIRPFLIEKGFVKA